MLAQKGFNVKKTGMTIIPIQIFENDTNQLMDVTIETQPVDRRSVVGNHLQYKFGNVTKVPAQNVENLIPTWKYLLNVQF